MRTLGELEDTDLLYLLCPSVKHPVPDGRSEPSQRQTVQILLSRRLPYQGPISSWPFHLFALNNLRANSDLSTCSLLLLRYDANLLKAG